MAEAVRKGKRGMPFATDFNLEKDEDFMIEEDDKRKVAAGFWAEGEESMGVDEDYFGDDLTSHGHGELAKHRQLRHYNRLVAWEMPLLNRALPLSFIPPGAILTADNRTRQTIHTPNTCHPFPLPLHILPQRITPRCKQSCCRIRPHRPIPSPEIRLQTNQTRGPPVQPRDICRQAVVREIRHAGAEQALLRRKH